MSVMKRLEVTSQRFLTAVKKQLKSKSLVPQFATQFDHDIFRYVFKDKGTPSNISGAIMLNKTDFERMLLPDTWHYTLKENGEGYAIEFPIRAKSVLKWLNKEFILMILAA